MCPVREQTVMITLPFSFLKKGFENLYVLYWGIAPVNNVMIVSGRQQRVSAIHIHVSILPQTPLRPRLPQNIEQSSLCSTVGPCW